MGPKTTRAFDGLKTATALGALLILSCAFIEPPRLPKPQALQIPQAPALALSQDDADRMTVPVIVDGRGPFPFVIDTGADRTVISSELANLLKLPAGDPVLMHDTGGADLTPTVQIGALLVGGRSIQNISAPTLAAANLGAMGMIGLDALADQRVVIDLHRGRMAVEPSRREVLGSDTIVVHAKSRYGQLVLVDASISGMPIAVILDSGAQNSVANLALRDKIMHLERFAHLGGDVVSVTGRTTPARFAYLPEVRIGGFALHQVPMAFADLHTFARFDMNGRPAMLLGMDMIRLFDRVSIDFQHKEVRFQLPLAADQPLLRLANVR